MFHRRLTRARAGYWSDMFKTVAALGRTFRTAVFPVSRTAIALLVWSNRHTLGLWYRSVRAEISANGLDLGRIRQLLRALWTVSNDRRTANEAALRSISVRPDGYGIEARDGWIGRATVEHLLAPMSPQPMTVSVA